MWEVGSGIYIYLQSGLILDVMAVTGYNQNASGLDEAFLLGVVSRALSSPCCIISCMHMVQFFLFFQVSALPKQQRLHF